MRRGEPTHRRRRSVVAGTVVLLLVLASAAPGHAAEDGVDAQAAGSGSVAAPVDVDVAEPVGLTASDRLGPVAGLGALVQHFAVGDPSGSVEPGRRGPEVAVAQARLEAMGFRPGTIDGVYGGQTVSAVLALQKHEGLERTGVLDPDTRAAMDGLVADGPRADLLGDRIEIDIDRQVMFLVMDGEVTIINTSTGNEQPYVRANGDIAIARTPRGDFAIGQRYNGVQVGFLGAMYRPMYFTGPYAIHGSSSVPAWPASHGCARTSNGDMDFLWTAVPGGLPVYSY